MTTTPSTPAPHYTKKWAELTEDEYEEKWFRQATEEQAE